MDGCGLRYGIARMSKGSQVWIALGMTWLVGCGGVAPGDPTFSNNDDSGGAADDEDDGDADEEEEGDDGEEEEDEGDDDGIPVTRLDAGGGGDSSANPDGGIGDCNKALVGVLRDFQSTHPDFERDIVGIDLGIVEPVLGPDGYPVYRGGSTGTTTDKASFDQWFRDVPGVNMTLPIAIPLEPQGNGNYVYDNRAFFPADDHGFGKEGNRHNYHFTLELRTKFEYQGGEIFTFRGDDDLFTFVNGHLGIDLGGVHLPLERTIDLDAVAAEFGMEVGEEYTLDFFFAERHTTMSNFRIETSIDCFIPVPVQ